MPLNAVSCVLNNNCFEREGKIHDNNNEVVYFVVKSQAFSLES